MIEDNEDFHRRGSRRGFRKPSNRQGDCRRQSAELGLHHRADFAEIHLAGVFTLERGHDLAHVADRRGFDLGDGGGNGGIGLGIIERAAMSRSLMAALIRRRVDRRSASLAFIASFKAVLIVVLISIWLAFERWSEAATLILTSRA